MVTSILDLPTELLLEIIHSKDSTDASTIACLGMTCRRLHNICQVVVLERQLPMMRSLMHRGFLLIYRKDSGSIAMEAKELHDVKDIFEVSFDKIELSFVGFATEEIGSVHGLIFHAYSVGHVMIGLDFLINDLYGSNEKKDWRKPLAAFMRASSEKEKSRLTVSGMPYGERGLCFAPAPTPKPSPSFLKGYLSRLGIFRPHKGRSSIHKIRSGVMGAKSIPRQDGAVSKETFTETDMNLNMRRGLESFDIHSALPFHEACFPLTLRILNGGCITRLSLWCTRLRISDWSNILPLLSMPLLSIFLVGDSDIAFRDLSLFLMRHPNITHLDLSYSSPIGPIVSPTLTGFLPRLEAVSGNPDYLLGFLSSERHLFPNLRSVALTRHPLRAIQHGALDSILRNLAHRKRATINLCIEFSDPSGLLEWFSKSQSEPCSLECVKRLEIVRCGFRMPPEMCESFFSWVSAFPFVQELDLTQVVPPDPKMWTGRLDALWDSCSELKSITVGIKTYQRPLQIKTYE